MQLAGGSARQATGGRNAHEHPRVPQTGAVVAIAALTTGLLAGCSKDSDDGSSDADGGSGGGKGSLTLTIGTFGVFGYKQAGLYDEYMKLHPDINIKENVTTRTDVYWPKVLTRLQAGSGTDDIQAIEVGNITEAVQTQADKFVDLGKEVDKSQWLDWKLAQATTKDGKTIGLGTDVGPWRSATARTCSRRPAWRRTAPSSPPPGRATGPSTSTSARST